MARPCTVCAHAERVAIEARVAAGEPLRAIGAAYGLSHAALSRHNREHRSPELLQVVVPLAEVRSTGMMPAAATLPELRAHANDLIGEAVAAQRSPEEYLALAAYLTMRAGAAAERSGSVSDMLAVTRALRQQAVAIAEVDALVEKRAPVVVDKTLAMLAFALAEDEQDKREAGRIAGYSDEHIDRIL